MTGMEDVRFSAVAPNVQSARLHVRSWFLDPAGVLIKVDAGAPVTAAVAKYVSEHIYTVMRAHFPLTSRFLYVHDFSEASSYEPRAREILTEWALRIPDQITRAFLIMPTSNNLFRMGISTAAMALRDDGIPIEVVRNLDEARSRCAFKLCGERSPQSSG